MRWRVYGKRIMVFILATTIAAVNPVASYAMGDQAEEISLEAVIEEAVQADEAPSKEGGAQETNPVETTPEETKPEETTPQETEPTKPPVKIKAHWDGKKYMQSDGTYAVGSKKIKDIYYIFKKNGDLATSKNGGVVKVKGIYYLAGKDGKALKGWYVFKDKIYHASSSGKCKMNTTYKGFKFDDKATVTKTTTARVKAKLEAVRIYRKITTPSMKKADKLKACWKYMIDQKRFRYALKYPDLNKKKTWFYTTAWNMLTTQTGNCYSFACAFAALANECGYDPYVVCGRVSGNRDHASDGLTRHSWVIINNRHYDPEGCFAGWYTTCYNSKSYVRRHTIQQKVRYEANR